MVYAPFRVIVFFSYEMCREKASPSGVQREGVTISQKLMGHRFDTGTFGDPMFWRTVIHGNIFFDTSRELQKTSPNLNDWRGI